MGNINDLSAEQLAWIFQDHSGPTDEERFLRYVAACALDFLQRATKADTLAEFQAYRRAYRLLNTGLMRVGYWPPSDEPGGCND